MVDQQLYYIKIDDVRPALIFSQSTLVLKSISHTTNDNSRKV
ncbi:hypothetical protein DYY67_1355 [Candidatus Nitrosotalea sp. TS]|nr:hypothetical protein [Candidatus Nitrosotalea sp. TS]